MVDAPPWRPPAFGSSPFDVLIIALWGLAVLTIIAWKYGWFHVFDRD